LLIGRARNLLRHILRQFLLHTHPVGVRHLGEFLL
jgi:hypothetical protein